MHDAKTAGPESSAVRVALWRAMHVEIDPPPHVFEDLLGLRLAAPDENWRRRPDMDPDGTKPFRASIVARARFIEDLVIERAGEGVSQYVILGAGLSSAPIRNRSARPSGMETAAPDRSRLWRSRMAATGPGRFRGGRALAAAIDGRGIRRGRARHHRFHGREYVSLEGSEFGRVAQCRRDDGSGLDFRDDLSAAIGACRS
jgi:hypothetical protein